MAAVIPTIVSILMKARRGGGGGGGGGYRGGYGGRPQQSPEEIANASAMKAASKEMIEAPGNPRGGMSPAVSAYIKAVTGFDPNSLGAPPQKALEGLLDSQQMR